MSEGVGADFLIYASILGSLLYDGENHHARQFRASVVEEYRILGTAVGVAVFEIELYAVAGNATHRHKALLVALARHAYVTLAKEEIAKP